MMTCFLGNHLSCCCWEGDAPDIDNSESRLESLPSCCCPCQGMSASAKSRVPLATQSSNLSPAWVLIILNTFPDCKVVWDDCCQGQVFEDSPIAKRLEEHVSSSCLGPQGFPDSPKVRCHLGARSDRGYWDEEPARRTRGLGLTEVRSGHWSLGREPSSFEVTWCFREAI